MKHNFSAKLADYSSNNSIMAEIQLFSKPSSEFFGAWREEFIERRK